MTRPMRRGRSAGSTRRTAPSAEARVAFQRDDPRAEALLAAAHAAERDDPGLMLDHARYLRQTERNADALALWRRDGAAAQDAIRASAPEHLSAFWAERNLLARALLSRRRCGGCLCGRQPRTARPRRKRWPTPNSSPASSPCASCTTRPPRCAISRSWRRCRRRRSPEARARYWQGRAEAPRARIRSRTTKRPPRGPPPSMASLPPWRWARPRPWHGGSTRCAIPPGPATPCSPSPAMRWCAPPPGWSPGATRIGRASS